MEPKTTKEIKSKCIRYSAPTPPAGQPKPSPAQTQNPTRPSKPPKPSHASKVSASTNRERDRQKPTASKPTPPYPFILLPRVPPNPARGEQTHPRSGKQSSSYRALNQPFPSLDRPPGSPDNAPLSLTSSSLTLHKAPHPSHTSTPWATTQQTPSIHHQ